MGYVGSYIWKLRQKVGDMRLLSASAGVVCVGEDGKILMVYNHKDLDRWAFPAGGVEEGLSWGQVAAKELLEEGGLTVRPEDLVPFVTLSGSKYVYEYDDGNVQSFTLYFVARKFEKDDTELDKEEISKVKWMSVEEAKNLPKSLSAIHILSAYEKWSETGEFQQVVIE